jgi:AraC-like DNA-binding protein
MSPFDEIIGGMRVASSLYARFGFRAPWGVRFFTGEHARLIVVSDGTCWLRWAGSDRAEELGRGTCLIVQPGIAFTLSDAPGGDAVACEQLVQMPGGQGFEHGGNGAPTELISGRFSFDAVAAEPLISRFPPLVHVQLDTEQEGLVRGTLSLIGAETRGSAFGSGMVLCRLGDALFIQALRAVCCQHRAVVGGWLAGLADQRLARALRALHADLARPWTVEAMANEAGLSRSAFAATFKDVVGEAPLDYLTGWRMYRAKVLLASSEESLTRIAIRVGYDTDAAFNRAFRRRFGVPPGQWRRDSGALHPATAPGAARAAPPAAYFSAGGSSMPATRMPR